MAVDQPPPEQDHIYAEAMETWQGIALGIRLELTTPAEGGRTRPLVDSPEQPFSYRPNWGLPTMKAGPCGQAGALVYRFSSPLVSPGESAHAVIVPPFPQMISQWRAEAKTGAVLPMYEGTRICGYGTILWVKDVQLPLTEADTRRFDHWLSGLGSGF